MCSESEARRIIGSDGAEQLIEIIQGGWKEYIKDGRARRSTPRANVVWDNMMDLAESGFAARDDVRIVPRNQSQAFVLKERLLLQFKLLDQNFRPRNIQTRTRQRLAESGYFDDMPEDLAVVTCGYRLDATESEIRTIRAVRHVNNALEWSIDLEELAAGVLAPASPIFEDIDPGVAVPRALPTIRPQRRREEGDQG
ncbi:MULTISPECIES: hypothetical protein [Rhodococcus]|uniref:hypothetical protein n=1 Tax=Rhodococcus TaxID=1827 RepID=UPI0009F4980A|nr:MULTISPECIES: hypothetical protein [Rhodococcus]ORC19963.1 hypothetical protein BXO91_22965 [Rhodococcus qingshengii]